ncbi:GLPGLI family protein [Flavobacterium psychrotrophum]|uniref:GLPGLI family protein n=1 Tax=Flavobacterium psychrotrophum TaxID=2294119 RepID=UPI000E323456|nr:GLPGLI family protein [Flavobacterium psychrotrophum]
MTRYLLIVLLYTINVFSQAGTSYKVEYNYKNIGLNENEKLELRLNKSDAISYFPGVQKSLDTVMVDQEENISFSVKPNDSIGRQYYFNGKTKQIVFREFVGISGKFLPVIVDEKIPNFNWQLKDDVKLINKMTCNKAIGKFRGRTYEVWYTKEIPTAFGPWKFNGLPGLVLEAKSTDNNIFIQVAKISTLTASVIKEPAKGKKITLDQYVTYKNNEVNDFIDRLKAKLPRGAQISAQVGENYDLEKSFE